MTIIMMHDRYMACDSRVISGSFVITDHTVQRKIVRAPCGALVGCMGSMIYSHHVLRWAKEGLNFETFPKLTLGPSDNPTTYLWTMMRPDGRKFIGDCVGQYHETSTDYLAGMDAVAYAYGIFDTLQLLTPHMTARQIVQRVMHMTIDRCPSVGGQIHIFDLDHPEFDP